MMSGISGHADRDMILDWLKAMGKTPKQVFVNHGDDRVSEAFADTIQKELGYPAATPYSGDGYDLITGECFQKGIIVPAVKGSAGRKRADSLYHKLKVALKRLSLLVDKMKGASNKDISRLTDQINSICDKFQ